MGGDLFRMVSMACGPICRTRPFILSSLSPLHGILIVSVATAKMEAEYAGEDIRFKKSQHNCSGERDLKFNSSSSSPHKPAWDRKLQSAKGQNVRAFPPDFFALEAYPRSQKPSPSWRTPFLDINPPALDAANAEPPDGNRRPKSGSKPPHSETRKLDTPDSSKTLNPDLLPLTMSSENSTSPTQQETDLRGVPLQSLDKTGLIRPAIENRVPSRRRSGAAIAKG
jgi:hypothetical protein